VEGLDGTHLAEARASAAALGEASNRQARWL